MLPSPLPDDPRKWDGWNHFSSPDLYERLGLSFESHPTNEEIEENTRQLLVWWQKKLPLKNQPSNPLAQMLRGGIDNAPRYIAEARVELLNPERRKQIDTALRDRQRVAALGEFKKFLDFALADKILGSDEEANLMRMGQELGLTGGDILGTVAVGLKRTGAVREADVPHAPAPPPPAAPAPPPAAPPTASRTAEPNSPQRTRRVRLSTPQTDFLRMLRLSGLDSETMSDDRRDTFIDMAENLGLDPGEAEDMVDEYLESVEDGSFEAVIAPTSPMAGERRASPPPAANANKSKTPVVSARPAAGGAPAPAPAPAILEGPQIDVLSAAEENRRFPDFATTLGTRMLFIPSSTFVMGSDASGAPVNEQPPTRVTLNRFYLSRHPITNGEYEKFDPTHKSRRGAWADERHPAIYVSHLDATKFCQWLSGRERKRYRLPTEAEWEYAAKGQEGRTYPWGETTGQGTLANFADANTTFPWADPTVNDGYAETSPVGSYPDGASFCGVEDLAGNVWEWCLDYYDSYKGGERTNPRGPIAGAQRVYRGGSWKSRFGSLKTTARGFNQPGYASNDVGFRIVCECE